MKRQLLLSSLLVLSMVGIQVTEVYAACTNYTKTVSGVVQRWTKCCNIINGANVCQEYRIGTTDGLFTIKNLDDFACSKPGSTVQCPEIQVKLYGTHEDPAPGLTCTPTSLDPDCQIAVTAVCGPQKCLNNPTGPGCDNMDFNSAHFNQDQIPGQVGGLSCPKNVCKNVLVSFLGDAEDSLCKSGHVLINAFADPFNAQECICPGGFDSIGQCCAAGQPKANPFCVATADLLCGPGAFWYIDRTQNPTPGEGTRYQGCATLGTQC